MVPQPTGSASVTSDQAAKQYGECDQQDVQHSAEDRVHDATPGFIKTIQCDLKALP